MPAARLDSMTSPLTMWAEVFETLQAPAAALRLYNALESMASASQLHVLLAADHRRTSDAAVHNKIKAIAYQLATDGRTAHNTVCLWLFAIGLPVCDKSQPILRLASHSLSRPLARRLASCDFAFVVLGTQWLGKCCTRGLLFLRHLYACG